MSLFSSREWWTTRLGDSEEFDQGSLCVANIDGDPSGAVKLVTASLQGVLRIHLPHGRDYRVEDCLLEAQLEAGVLQIAAGRFAGSNAGLCLAVLFPRKVAVLKFQAARSSFLQMTRLFEHPLEHTAANMAVGAFGSSRAGCDSICVQSYDGQLSFFEGGVHTFSRFLPNFLVPGPLCYCPATDSFVTCSAALELESYRYSALAAAGPGKEQDGAAAASGGGAAAGGSKRVQADWKLVLGESAVDIALARVAPGAAAGAGGGSSGGGGTAGGGRGAGGALGPLTAFAHGASKRDLGASRGGAAAFGAAAAAAGGAAQQELLVVCEHCLFVVSAAGGQLLLQRRLEYHPACCWPYPAPPEAGAAGGGGGGGAAAAGADNLLVATHTRALLVYQGPALAWAARLELQPVALRTAELGGVRGMIVALDDEGRLLVFYLGTDPPSHAVAAAADARPMDYAAMDEEHRGLLARIKAAGGADSQLVEGAAAAAAAAVAAASRLVIKAQVPSRLDALSDEAGFGGLGGGGGGGSHERQVTVRLLLTHSGPAPLKDVHLSVSAPAPVAASDTSLQLDTVLSSAAPVKAGAGASGEATTIHLTFFEGGEARGAVPASNMARVVATWKQPGSGEQCSSSLEFALPLALFCSAVTAVKTAECKLTLEANRDPPHMQLLFHDLVAQAAPAQAEALARLRDANVLGLQFGAAGPVVSVLVSKAGARYRVQSDCFHAMWLVVQELTQRLAAHYRAADAKPGAPPPPDGGKLLVTLQEPLPLQDVFDLVEAHFVTRGRERELAATLEGRAQQFRSVQKRLLVRFKDKTPAPLAELDTLMGETYDQLVTLADEQEAAQVATREAAQALAAGVRLLLLLARFKFGLADEDLAVLTQAMNPPASSDDGSEVGWEEEVEAAMTHLLRSSLARNAKEAAAQVPPLVAAKDTQRLRKHLALVLERLAKGMRLTAPQAGGGAAAGARAGGALTVAEASAGAGESQ